MAVLLGLVIVTPLGLAAPAFARGGDGRRDGHGREDRLPDPVDEVRGQLDGALPGRKGDGPDSAPTEVPAAPPDAAITPAAVAPPVGAVSAPAGAPSSASASVPDAVPPAQVDDAPPSAPPWGSTSITSRT